MNNGCLGFPRRTSGTAGEVGPDLALVDASGVVWARIVVDADNEVAYLGAGDDPDDIVDGAVPRVIVGGTSVQLGGGAAGSTFVTVDGTSVTLTGSDGVDTGVVYADASGVTISRSGLTPITVGASGVSIAAGSGIDGTDTVADATDNASAILRLNELLAVLRDFGVLAP